MYRDHPGGRVSNDTITVRVFDGAGSIQNGVIITSQALKSPQQVSPQVNSVSDTIAKPWGTDQPLLYYGGGDSDPTLPEIISSEAILHSDTVARGEVRFLVHDPVQLMLFGPDTMYRNVTNGHVLNDTISVRLFNNSGGLLGGVPVNCRCQLSPDSVTPLVTSSADTIVTPWGSNVPVIYFGGGDRGDPSHQEIVTCWSAVNGDTTTAEKAFYVWNH